MPAASYHAAWPGFALNQEELQRLGAVEPFLHGGPSGSHWQASCECDHWHSESLAVANWHGQGDSERSSEHGAARDGCDY